MRKVRFAISLKLLEEALHLPANTMITGINTIPDTTGTTEMELIIYDDKESKPFRPECSIGYVDDANIPVMQVFPTVVHKEEQWIWDWNIKNGI